MLRFLQLLFFNIRLKMTPILIEVCAIKGDTLMIDEKLLKLLACYMCVGFMNNKLLRKYFKKRKKTARRSHLQIGERFLCWISWSHKKLIAKPSKGHRYMGELWHFIMHCGMFWVYGNCYHSELIAINALPWL